MIRFSLGDRMIQGGDWHVGRRRVGPQAMLGEAHRHHGFHEIMLGLEGRSEDVIRGVSYDLEVGDLHFIGETDTHHVGGCHCMWSNIAFTTSYLNWADTALRCNGRIIRLISAPEPPRGRLSTVALAAARERIDHFQTIKQGGDSTDFRLLLLECCAVLADSQEGRSDDDMPDWLRDGLASFAKLSVGEWSRQNLRELCGCSNEHLCRSIRHHLGCSPTDHINTLRLELAAEQLIDSDDPVTDIAFAVGYGSLNHFYVRFHRHFGCAPLEYRQRQRLTL